ncbi:hypothetical protein KDAU_74250 [Dictyobacter aurantiacus]|uniref:Uncharacterized protein n=1 Tax=Dictyobacter aurantiacus TaxID=1936993 RepID=A0A401ZTH2_9CHLR|nr:hypothetical protein KDAU_74250 [Dictyobacter aurantiacus]
MQRYFESGNDTKVPATSTQTPEQFSILLSTGTQKLSICSDQFYRSHLVNSQAIFPHHPANPTTKQQTPYPYSGSITGCEYQTIRLKCMRHLTPGETGLNASST